MISKALRKFAKGQECQVWLYPWCKGQTETVVLAHLHDGTGGMGLKAGSDLEAVLACATCHDILDGRQKVDLDPIELERAKRMAGARTRELLYQNGLIRIKGVEY